jgi:hypothetical protein
LIIGTVVEKLKAISKRFGGLKGFSVKMSEDRGQIAKI